MEPVLRRCVGYVLFHSHVEITAAKTKRTNGSFTRLCSGFNPGPGFGVQVERAVFQLKCRIGFIHLYSGWQHLVVQGHDHLEQRRRTGSCFGMPDLRFDGSESTVLLIRSGAS